VSAVTAALAWANPKHLVPVARRYPLTSVVSGLTIVVGIAAVVLRCVGALHGRTPDTLGGAMARSA
jgi:phosphatidylglycerol lysyltransferase